MIGWKVVCEIKGKEVVAEVASQPFALGEEGHYSLLVYHDGSLKRVWFYPDNEIKVVER